MNQQPRQYKKGMVPVSQQAKPVKYKRKKRVYETRSFRHELKYFLTLPDYYVAQTRLRQTMDHDPNADENGEYFIRSLYFDDFEHSMVRSKVDGVEVRSKYRIRIYNCSQDNIKLEIKEKSGQYISKRSLRLELDEYERIVQGDASFLMGIDSTVARDMYIKMRLSLLRPVVVVDYTREAFVHPAENVRVTFDKYLRSGEPQLNIFDRHLPTTSVLDSPGVIMEVKFNNHLPNYFHSLVQTDRAIHGAISKYVFCRKYDKLI